MADIVLVEPKISKWISGEPVKLEELYTDIDSQAYDSQLATILNQEPKKSWIKTHPIAKNVQYIPIEKLEFMLSYFFADWYVEIKESKLLANSLVVTVRVHYKRPDGNWRWSDGIGAVAVQTKQGAGATDFMLMNSNAVQIGLPAAESYAFKDAVEKLGRIFGKDLNRKEPTSYDVLLGANGESRFKDNIEVDKPNLTDDVPDFLKPDFKPKDE